MYDFIVFAIYRCNGQKIAMLTCVLTFIWRSDEEYDLRYDTLSDLIVICFSSC